MEIVVGTAGHIDHGKTALIKALTGIDTDRLPEEKERGITIDIGFAEMAIGDLKVGFVDVPGHEKFVKNMLAGVSGIDFVMLIVAADEGVMPQTREHFDICCLLNVAAGLIVLTKSDLVDEETIDLARLDVAELVKGSFLESAPVTIVSSRSGEGIDQLKINLAACSASLNTRKDAAIARLPIDRSFTVKGFGPVVTGTLVSGMIASTAELDLLPAGRKVRVRGLQTHGRTVSDVRSGQRVAINLAGIDHSEISRGMTLGEGGVLRPTQIIDAEIEVLSEAKRALRSRQRVRIHIGTAEVLARLYLLESMEEIEPGSRGLAQLRLESPVVAVMDERFIVRQYSPQTTIAGGRVLDVLAEKHRTKDLAAVRRSLMRLKKSEGGHTVQIETLIEAAGRNGMSLSTIQARTALRKDILEQIVAALVADTKIVETEERYLSTEIFDEIVTGTRRILTDFHKAQPLERGMSTVALRGSLFEHLPIAIFRLVIARLETAGMITVENEIVRLTEHRSDLSPAEQAASQKIVDIYTAAAFDVPRLNDVIDLASDATGLDAGKVQKLLTLLLKAGEVVKVTDEFYFSRASIDTLTKLLRETAGTTSDSTIDVAKFKAAADISRKYAIPLLEYFDRSRITVRIGDRRKVL